MNNKLVVDGKNICFILISSRQVQFPHFISYYSQFYLDMKIYLRHSIKYDILIPDQY